MMKRSGFSAKVTRLFKKLKSDKRAIVLPMFAIMFAAMSRASMPTLMELRPHLRPSHPTAKRKRVVPPSIR